MKTKVISTLVALFAVVLCSNAQSSSDYFFDRKYEDGKVVTSTRYELGYSGLFEKSRLTTYSYNEEGEVTKKETFNWNSKRSEWIPEARIDFTHDFLVNSCLAEYSLWNGKKGEFGAISERAVYRFDQTGSILSCAFLKEDSQGKEKVTASWKKEVLYLAM